MVEIKDSQYRFRGRLEDTPLPLILKKIDAYKVPGVVTIRRPGATKQLFLKNGKIVFAASTQNEDRLGEFLLRQGLVTREQLQEAIQLLVNTGGKRMGRILVELGYLTPHQLFQAVMNQIRMIVMSMFTWEEGDATFIIGEFKDDELIKLNLPIPRAIMMGVRHMPNTVSMLLALGGMESVFERHPRLKFEIHELGIEPRERRMLAFVNGSLTVREVMQRVDLEQDLVIRLLYGLYILDRIQRVST